MGQFGWVVAAECFHDACLKGLVLLWHGLSAKRNRLMAILGRA
jgi:hypothetical protein